MKAPKLVIKKLYKVAFKTKSGLWNESKSYYSNLKHFIKENDFKGTEVVLLENTLLVVYEPKNKTATKNKWKPGTLGPQGEEFDCNYIDY